MENIFQKKHFVFDLDGTLINSNKLHDKAFKETLSNENIVFDYSKYHGVKTMDVFKSLGFNEFKSKDLTKNKQMIYRRFIENGLVETFPGVSRLFDLLVKFDKKIYLCTGASRKSVNKIIRTFSWEDIFSDTICGDEVELSKPNPLILNSLISRNNISKPGLVYIEDSDKGLETGLSAGVDTVIVNNQFDDAIKSFPEFLDFYDYVAETFLFKGVA